MSGDRLLFATGNAGKFAEAAVIMKRYGLVLERSGLKGTEVQEDDVALVARAAAASIFPPPGASVIVEDAGLYIDALKGFPGAYSAHALKTLGNEGILKLMEGVADRGAHFDSAVALKTSEGLWVFTGRVYGRVAGSAAGVSGFGFDPIFVPEGSARTFGEMGQEEKCRLSHRALSFGRLASWLNPTLY
ncbi:MAG: RdgB/HAM1 family non-canonical purine NTP pyrophosphatase [Nitrososphaerota archaeon]|nr:RdgB/HAM1 family non-canonical purine NTP pyrophosphatase [Nitrososphaerota archaeon]